MIHWTAVAVMWLREMKRFLRARSRIVGALAMPLFFLAFMGLGFNRMAVPGLAGGAAGGAAAGTHSLSYLRFLVPGIIGMSMLFTSTFAGLSVLWDREFGFLKEIMVAPVSRVSLVLGRIAGGTTTTLIQGLLLLSVSIVLGFRPGSWAGLVPAVLFMFLIAVTFIGLGLVFASNMKDMQGFSIIMNFIMFPLLFLSGALYPMKNLPVWLRPLSYADPLTYGIDGMRAALLGVSMFSAALNLVVLAGFSLLMVVLGAYFFEHSESV